MNYNNLVAVLYSWEQDCYHIETIEDYILSNKRSNETKVNHQYRLIYICESDYEAREFINDYR